jgi:hypothetical protein
MSETETLVKAALAVCDRWDTPDWSDHRHTADFIRDLRAAAAAWNTRPSVDREAVDEDAIILAMCKAHDREDAAQMGEPSPWREDFDRDLDWEQGRFLAMREAFDEARAILSLIGGGGVPAELVELSARATQGKWTISPPWSGFSSIKADGLLVFGLAAGGDDERRPADQIEANAAFIAAAVNYVRALLSASTVEG